MRDAITEISWINPSKNFLFLCWVGSEESRLSPRVYPNFLSLKNAISSLLVISLNSSALRCINSHYTRENSSISSTSYARRHYHHHRCVFHLEIDAAAGTGTLFFLIHFFSFYCVHLNTAHYETKALHFSLPAHNERWRTHASLQQCAFSRGKDDNIKYATSSRKQ